MWSPLHRQVSSVVSVRRGWGLALCLLAIAGSLAAAGRAEPRVREIVIAGNRRVPEATIRQAITTRVGEPLSRQRLDQDRAAIERLGYFRTVAPPRTQVESGEATVVFQVTELPEVLYVRITGNVLIERSTIQRAIQTRVGEVLCLPKLLDDLEAVRRLYRDRGYVAIVSESTLDEAVRSGIVRVEIVELTIGEVRFHGVAPEQEARLRRVVHETVGRPYQPAAVAADAHRLRRVRGVRQARPHVELIAAGTGKVRVNWYINPTEPVPRGETDPRGPSLQRSPR